MIIEDIQNQKLKHYSCLIPLEQKDFLQEVAILNDCTTTDVILSFIRETHRIDPSLGNIGGTPTTTISCRIPKELKAKLETIAAKNNTIVAKIFRAILTRQLLKYKKLNDKMKSQSTTKELKDGKESDKKQQTADGDGNGRCEYGS